jgi:hypothetical protein
MEDSMGYLVKSYTEYVPVRYALTVILVSEECNNGPSKQWICISAATIKCLFWNSHSNMYGLVCWR